MTQVELIDRQLESYNAHDLDGFCSCYAAGAELWVLGEDRPFIDTPEALREAYAKKFSNPTLRAKIVNRIVRGRHVIDQERVEGAAPQAYEVVVIYEVADDLIRKVHLIRD